MSEYALHQRVTSHRCGIFDVFTEAFFQAGMYEPEFFFWFILKVLMHLAEIVP